MTRTLAAILVLLVFANQFARGEDYGLNEGTGISLGMSASLKSIDTQLYFPEKSDFRSMLCASIDMEGIYSGKYDDPGFILSYYGLFLLGSWPLGREAGFKLYGGPGCSAGYARDRKRDYGFIAGLSGRIGGEFFFASPFSITISFTPVLACRITGEDQYENVMDFYRNGIYKAYYPEIGVKLAF